MRCLLILLPFFSFGQNVKTALQLKQALLSDSKLITVVSNINLAELPSTDFPLIIKKGVTLRGQYSLLKNRASKITFPYEFIDGAPCSLKTDDIYSKYKGFAFEMKDSSVMENIFLSGTQPYVKDWRFKPFGYCNTAPIREGVSSGVIVTGIGCSIRYCELANFSYFAAEYVPDKKGDFTFEYNYVHDCKEMGYGYGLWVAPGRSTNLNCVDSFGKNTTDVACNAFIRYNIFRGNKHDIAASGGRVNMVIQGNTFYNSGSYNIDRHGVTTTKNYKDVGGDLTFIDNNNFYSTSQNIGITYPNINCGMAAKNIITNNKFKAISEKLLNIQIADIADTNRFSGDTNIVINGNMVNDFRTVAIQGLSFGRIGQSITFTASDTTLNYIWDINGATIKGKTATYKFNKIGVYAISCFGIDKNNYGTEIAVKEVTIAPDDGKTYVVFNIADNYKGATQTTCGTFIPNNKPTGFIKYATFNGKQIWADDIAGDEKWRTVYHPVKIDSINTFEIGLRADRMVDADTVRGVAFFVDDVYINKPDGTNYVLNGTFETIKEGTTTQPANWVINSTPEKPFYIDCKTGKEYNINLQGAFLSGQMAKSGVQGMYGIVRQLLNYNIGLKYNTGKYFNYSQKFIK